MAIEDRIIQDMTPGMRLSIKGAAARYSCSYSGAQKALRNLWRHQFLDRDKNKNLLFYEGKQERLV